MNKELKYILSLIILAYFFFFFGNSLIGLTNPDEVFYAQTAKEMIKHHSWLTPILFDEPQFEKPILIYWLLRTAFLIFGINSFSARFFSAAFALCGVISVYCLAKLLFGKEKKAFISALILLSSCLYIGLARTVFTDMVFSIMILLALLSFYWGYTYEKRKGTGIILFFIFSALATLTKGPIGLLIPFLIVTAFLLSTKRTRFIFCYHVFWGIAIFLAIASPWYIFMIAKYNQGFIHEFFYNDHYRRFIEAEHPGNDTWYFYPLTMIGCMFPWSIFVAAALLYLLRRLRKMNTTDLFLLYWITAVIIVFQFAHSKLSSYIFPMSPALAMIAGNFIYGCLTDKEKQRQFTIISAITWFITLLALTGIIGAVLKFHSYLSSLQPDYFIVSLFGLWLAITAFYILKNRYFFVFNSFIVLMAISMAIIPFTPRDIESYFSSKYACEYLLNNCAVDPKAYLLCSKDFVRGTRFYTDIKIAVYGSNFFSPHPIPFVSSDEQIKEFLHQQKSTTYGFIKKSSIKDLERAVMGEYDIRVLKKIGNQLIVKIQQR